jgi:hypothetical protein
MSKKKQSIKKITETFRWKPSPAIEWILKNDRTKFMENHQYAPLSILLEEHGLLEQALGQLHVIHKNGDNYWNDERGKELHFRIDYIQEKIKAKYYGMVEMLDRMDYNDMLDAKSSKDKESK